MNLKDVKILALIPARGGSKGIPGKNIKEFCGKPLIAWSIEAAKQCDLMLRVVVSTDDDKIAKIAKKFGAEVPFKRPAELAEDSTPTLPVMVHAVKYFREKENYLPEYILLLEPTSPGRQTKHIKEAIELALKTGADSVVSVIEAPTRFSPYWQFRVGDNQRLEIATGGSINNIITRRQNLPKTYMRDGVIYLFKTELLFKPKPSIYGADARAYIMDSAYSMDIDTLEDWSEAERKMKLLLDNK